MTESVIALVVHPDESVPVAITPLLAGSHEELVALVDDVNTDAIFLIEAEGIAFVAENGKTLPSHAPNPRATQTVNRFLPGFAKADRIEGPAVFLGRGADGEIVDAPQAVLDFLIAMYRVSDGPTT